MHSHSLTAPVGWLAYGLNPCFNGRCTRTTFMLRQLVKEQSVLILVLMEDALAHRCLKLQGLKLSKVLILVLMEDALARWQFFENLGRTYSS